jgi:hypothetical protein
MENFEAIRAVKLPPLTKVKSFQISFFDSSLSGEHPKIPPSQWSMAQRSKAEAMEWRCSPVHQPFPNAYPLGPN